MKKKIISTGLFIVLMLLLSIVKFAQGQNQEQNVAGATNQASWFDEDPNNIEETLIDFTKFEENIKSSGLYLENDEIRTKNISDLTDQDIDPKTLRPKYQVQSSDLYYDKWRVDLNSSASEVPNNKYSYTKKIKLKKPYKGTITASGRPANGTGETVLGTRIRFPKHDYNAYAVIHPKFEIASYDKEGRIISTKKTGKNIGVINNVGKIKRLSIDVSGRNHMKGIAVRLKDQFDNVKEYFMGYTHFIGWRKLNWINTSYIDAKNTRDNLFKVPLYPSEIPYRKFDSIVVYRPGISVGGDFIVYFRKIDMWFDYAVSPELENDLDINDESQWSILSDKALAKYNKQLKKHRENIEMLRQEEKRQAQNKNTKKQEPQQQ